MREPLPNHITSGVIRCGDGQGDTPPRILLAIPAPKESRLDTNAAVHTLCRLISSRGVSHRTSVLLTGRDIGQEDLDLIAAAR